MLDCCSTTPPLSCVEFIFACRAHQAKHTWMILALPLAWQQACSLSWDCPLTSPMFFIRAACALLLWCSMSALIARYSSHADLLTADHFYQSGLQWMQVVLVVVRALRMSPGKIGAQCAHAAVGLYKVLAANRVPWLSAWEVQSLLCQSLVMLNLFGLVSDAAGVLSGA